MKNLVLQLWLWLLTHGMLLLAIKIKIWGGELQLLLKFFNRTPMSNQKDEGQRNHHGEVLFVPYCFSNANYSAMHGRLLPWKKNFQMSLFPH